MSEGRRLRIAKEVQAVLVDVADDACRAKRHDDDLRILDQFAVALVADLRLLLGFFAFTDITAKHGNTNNVSFGILDRVMLDPQIPLLPFFITDQRFHGMGTPSQRLVKIAAHLFPGRVVCVIGQNIVAHSHVSAVMGFHRPRMGLVVFNIAILLVDGKKRDIQSFGNTMRKLSLAVPRIFHLLQFRDVANHADENLSSRSRHRTRTDLNRKHFACALSVQRAEQNAFTTSLPQLRIDFLHCL